ncbi:FAD-dependent oxidoreductase [Cyanobium sp. NIES-981]|uniref:FAD-dependent oxidoreductase n=1 Tax=Cyanobium sp. NIES-981 TaxID=1851505 RepID=UPI0007DDC1E0|nr:FAD-dependent oxidoreductase [Cyanobium sp. NIES-981]SBO42297.1 conserved protein of unknown function [Cyanobium sp. NIES-981]
MQDERYPVVVWGGGTGGVAAALQAGRTGTPTLLLTPGAWLGGMVSAAGVCCPDGNELTPWQTGLWGALLRELAQREPEGLDHNWVSCFGYRPATAEAILREWVAAAAPLAWWPNCRLLEVERRQDRVSRLVLERRRAGQPTGETVALPVHDGIVIDGSDRGELIAMAGAGYRLGWEPKERWQEPSAPAASAIAGEPFFSSQPVQSPTWVVMGQLRGDAPGPDPGQALPEPFAGATSRFGLERTITYGRLPGGLVMLNWPLEGNDWHHGLGAAFGDAASREDDLNRAMREHSLAFAAALEQASGGWISLAEVFPRSALEPALQGPSPLALMPYWREGRRLKGVGTVIEQQLLPQGSGASLAPLPRREGEVEAVAVGNYANDHHYPGRDWPLAPKSCAWGGRWSGTPFCLPFSALVSRDTANLMAADKGISVSHMANGATRLQPLVLNVGQAAGQAAALCHQLGCLPATLPVRRLQHALVLDAQAPAGPLPLWDTPWHHPAWRERQLAALDDPSRLEADGTLRGTGAELDPCEAPSEPHERLWEGRLHSDGAGRYSLETRERSWPVITLEPALHRWLQQLETPRVARLIGCANPWGPWLRLSRLQS